MMAFRTLLIALVCGTACVEAREESAADGGVRALSEDDALEIGELSPGDDPDVCDLLPSCGVCSLACDPDALAATLPLNTCAALLCTLTDGRTIVVHACHR